MRKTPYDKNGNSSYLGADIHFYDVESHLSQINVWTWTPISTYYLYDGSGEMVRRHAQPLAYPDQGEKDTFVDGIYQEHSTGCGATTTVTKYYYALGRVIASRSTGVTNAYMFYAADHLGSTVATMDGTTGAVLSRQQYYPFGSPRTGTPPEKGYTGQQQESASSTTLGTYYYHARFYSTALGKFPSADSRVEEATPRGFNRHAYTGNNPVRYNDPSGHCFLGKSYTWEDAQEWLRCAMICGDNWLGDIARAALSHDSFWNNFAIALGMQENRTIAVAELFETIAANARTDNLHTLFTNDIGGNYLASVFGAGFRAEYFEASLHDVLFGTNRVNDLSISYIEGASDWGDGLVSILVLRGNVSNYKLHNLSSVGFNLARRTLDVAREYQSYGGDPNTRQWSQQQRGWLHGNGLDVDLASKETSVYQMAASKLVGCAANPKCFADFVWRQPWELGFR